MIENFAQLSSFVELLRTSKLDRKAYASPDYTKLRFKLGTSLAETKVPFALEPAFRETLQAAADSLFLAIPMRHRDSIGPADLDAVLLDPASLNISLRPASWYLGDVPSDSVFYRIIHRSLKLNRRLDAGMLLWWFGKEAPGRKLVTEINRFINKCDTEGAEQGAGEETLRIGLYMLLRFWSRYRSGVSERAQNPLMKEAYNAMAVVHAEIISALLEDRFRPTGVTVRPIGDPAGAAYQALTLPLTPLAFATSETDFAADAVGPFGLSARSVQTLERFFPKMLDRATPLPEVVKQLVQKITADKAAPAILLADIRLQRLYDAGLDILTKLKPGEAKGPETLVQEEIFRLWKDPEAFYRVIDDKKQSKEWAESWKRLTLEPVKPQMEAFQKMALDLGKLSEGFFSDKAMLEKAYVDQVHRFVRLRHLEALNAAVIDSTRLFQEFTGAKEAFAAEYDSGRIYRVASDEMPLLRVGSGATESQLFIDLKDFTKRTFASKEAAMADFMKYEFYEPILKAGKKYTMNMAHLDNNSISINNLLGDAISAAGNVNTLLHFAYDIINICENYRGNLAKKMPAALVASKLKEIEDKYGKEKAALEAERAKYMAGVQKLQADLTPLAPQDPKRVQVATQLRGYQEAAATADRKLRQTIAEQLDARSLIEGSGLEAGAYIAFGSVAEILTFKDDVFGSLKVAIGEKINESARGTARDASVKDQLNHLIDKARAATRNRDMEYPFKVYVDNSIHPVIDADLELALRNALAMKDAETVKKAVNAFSQRLLNDLVANVKRDEPDFRAITISNGIYNQGIAISGDAIAAYETYASRRRQVFKRNLIVAELHEEIKRNFVFPKATYPMVLVAPEQPGEPAEIFVDLGTVVFKGFEKKDPQAVYECLLQQSKFYKALVKHHLAAWLGGNAVPG